MDKKQNLVWIDLEMTGLDPFIDHILEVSLLITDGNLQILHDGVDFVIHQSDTVLEAMNPWCIEHHRKSGLTDAVRASTTTLEQAQGELLAVIKQFCEPRRGVLAGNSVWQDRTFLMRNMPLITDYLHYRLLDVTAFKEAIVRWYPNDERTRFAKGDSHRALADIRESVAELAHYRKYFFREM